jgi:hypothetical protein
VLDTIDLATARFVDAQSAERGYVATCSKVLLLPYRADMPRVYSDIATLRLLTADNPDQTQRVEKLHNALTEEFGRMNMAITTSAAIATERANRLREAVKRLHVRLSGKTLSLVTLSAGVATFPANGSNGMAVVAEADAALYRAKQNGPDRVEAAASPPAAAQTAAAS